MQYLGRKKILIGNYSNIQSYLQTLTFLRFFDVNFFNISWKSIIIIISYSIAIIASAFKRFWSIDDGRQFFKDSILKGFVRLWLIFFAGWGPIGSCLHCLLDNQALSMYVLCDPRIITKLFRIGNKEKITDLNKNQSENDHSW